MQGLKKDTFHVMPLWGHRNVFNIQLSLSLWSLFHAQLRYCSMECAAPEKEIKRMKGYEFIFNCLEMSAHNRLHHRLINCKRIKSWHGMSLTFSLYPQPSNWFLSNVHWKQKQVNWKIPSEVWGRWRWWAKRSMIFSNCIKLNFHCSLIEPSCFELRTEKKFDCMSPRVWFSQQVTLHRMFLVQNDMVISRFIHFTHIQHIRLNWNSICLNIIETLALSGVNFSLSFHFHHFFSLTCPCHQWHFDCTANNTHTRHSTLSSNSVQCCNSSSLLCSENIREKSRAVCNLWGWAQNVCSQYFATGCLAEFSISNSSENQNANTCEHHGAPYPHCIQI